MAIAVLQPEMKCNEPFFQGNTKYMYSKEVLKEAIKKLNISEENQDNLPVVNFISMQNKNIMNTILSDYDDIEAFCKNYMYPIGILYEFSAEHGTVEFFSFDERYPLILDIDENWGDYKIGFTFICNKCHENEYGITVIDDMSIDLFYIFEDIEVDHLAEIIAEKLVFTKVDDKEKVAITNKLKDMYGVEKFYDARATLSNLYLQQSKSKDVIVDTGRREE